MFIADLLENWLGGHSINPKAGYAVRALKRHRVMIPPYKKSIFRGLTFTGQGGIT